MRTSAYDRGKEIRIVRGAVLGTRAAANAVVVSDGETEVVPAAEIIFNGASVTDLGDNVASVDLDTGVRTLLNNSGSAVAKGDVVVTDPTADEAFTTTTTEGVTQREVGVVQASIANGDRGPVLFSGYTSALRVDAAVTRGHFAKTSTSAKVATSNATREDGSFAVFLTGADPTDVSYSLSDYIIDTATSVLDAAGTALTVDMPATRPDGLFMLLVLWIDGTASAPLITGWTRIGATDGFYYYRRTASSEPASYAMTWTGSSKAVAAVVVLDVVDVVSPVADFDYDSAGTAATITGLADDYYLLVAGVDRAEATPTGWTALATVSTADDSINGTLVAQVISGTGGTSPFPGTTGPGGPATDLNLTATLSTPDTAVNDVTLANDGNDTTSAIFGGAGTNEYIDSDLGAPASVTSFDTVTNDFASNVPTTAAYSTDGLSWSAIPGSWTDTGPDTATFTFTAPVTARYWRMGWGGRNNRIVKTWKINGQTEVGNDALLALDITATPLTVVPVPSALLFGVPDLGVAAAATALDDLTDVDTAGVVDGDVLTWDDYAGLWVPAAPVTDAELNIEGGQDVVKAHGTLGATEACDPTDGNVHTGTLDQDCTITLSAPTGSGGSTLSWWVTQDGTGGWDVTFAATGGTVTDDGTITPDTTGGVTVRYILERVPGTSNDWIRNIVGGGAPVTFGTPNLTLGTSNAAGATDEVMRRDATIAVFDATVPVTQAFGDTASAGAAAVAARRDHRHGMPAGATGGHILITDTPAGSPLVFADLLQNDDGTDLLYADA